MLLLIVLMLVGFYKTYFSLYPDFNERITVFHHLHALIAFLWILTLIAQPLLIRYKKFSIHRVVGKISYVIFPLLILSFVSMTYKTLQSDHPIAAFYPIADCILLIVCYTLAIINKKRTSKHMRYMIGAAIVFLGPTFGRIGTILIGLSEVVNQNIQYVIIYIILIALILMDKKYKKSYKPYLIIGVGYIVHQITFNALFL